MKLLPQIRLRTFFLMFFCAAVGMTCATAPESEESKQLKSFDILSPRLDLHYALLTAAATATVVGLVQQARTLNSLTRPANANDAQFKFARSFAINWRILLASIIGVCIVSRILISRKAIHLPEHTDLYLNQIFPDQVLWISVIVVLIDCVRRWQPVELKHSLFDTNEIALILGACFALLILPDRQFITYLVNVAMQGIECAAPLVHQRPGIYPNHQIEHYRTFWLSFSAIIVLLFAAIALSWIHNAALTKKPLLMATCLFVCLVCVAAVFCYWFYASEYYRVAPDFESVGFASNWLDWLCSAVLVAIAVSAGAYRLALRPDSHQNQQLKVCKSNNDVALHESPLSLIMLFSAAVAFFFEVARSSMNQPAILGKVTIAEKILSFLQSPESYLVIAITILSLQLCWIRWKGRNEIVAWNLIAIDRSRFNWNWLALALLAIVAVPTISIYCFTFWMGPWYWYGS
jgi:hypothetical protein